MDHLTDRRFSQRCACRLVGLLRSVAWYRLKGRDDPELRHCLKVLERYPRYGYLTLHEMLKQEGRVINRKRMRSNNQDERGRGLWLRWVIATELVAFPSITRIGFSLVKKLKPLNTSD